MSENPPTPPLLTPEKRLVFVEPGRWKTKWISFHLCKELRPVLRYIWQHNISDEYSPIVTLNFSDTLEHAEKTQSADMKMEKKPDNDSVLVMDVYDSEKLDLISRAVRRMDPCAIFYNLKKDLAEENVDTLVHVGFSGTAVVLCGASEREEQMLFSKLLSFPFVTEVCRWPH